MNQSKWVWVITGLVLNSLAIANPRLVDELVLKQIANETSGVSAKRNLDKITLYHRTRASRQFRQAAEHVRDQLREYGFENAVIHEYPADGRTLYGTQKSRLAWDVEFAQLWEVTESGERLRRMADWESMPLSLAQDSLSGAVTTTLVDIGDGTDEAHYEGLDVRGKLVLTESQPGAVIDLAVGKYGAAGIVSYAPNQRSAWWKEDDRLVRWGHMGSFPKDESRSFGFMISLGEARALQARLAAGEAIHLDAQVTAAQDRGTYSLVEAVIEGIDKTVAEEQIVFTCHLDHPRPGANDNASGCVSILESARTLKRLFDLQLIPAPRRSIRFVWPAEIEGSIIYLASDPELAARIKANIHLDMVGGNANTKAVYRISGGPYSLPHFTADLGHAIGRFVNAQTLAFAGGAASEYPLVSPEGGKEPLLAIMEGLSMGSDHDVFHEGSWGIPGIYLHDWPDRYIHTNFDTAANIDPTKLKRSAFIGAVTAWYLATMDDDDIPALLALLRENTLRRAGDLLAAYVGKDELEAASISRVHWERERATLASVQEFATVKKQAMDDALEFINKLEQQTGRSGVGATAENDYTKVYSRNTAIKGPMHAFGYSYLEDKLDPEILTGLKLEHAPAYEALNLVNGKRNVAQINDWLLAAFGSSDPAQVLDYLQALESINVIQVQ